MAHKAKSTKRFNDALSVRDAALVLVRKYGELIKIENVEGRFLSYQSDVLHILHRTPFQQLPQLSAKLRIQMALAAQHGVAPKLNKGYGLDIWHMGKKVFNVEWNDLDEMEIVRFQPGDWRLRLHAEDR